MLSSATFAMDLKILNVVNAINFTTKMVQPVAQLAQMFILILIRKRVLVKPLALHTHLCLKNIVFLPARISLSIFYIKTFSACSNVHLDFLVNYHLEPVRIVLLNV